MGGTELDPKLVDGIESINGIETVAPFIDFQTTLKGDFSEPVIALIRGVSPQIRDSDPVLARHLSLESGQFNLDKKGTIVLGAELALSQGLFSR
jgi:ABC-type lipoprotein release transport system permease subunit